MWNTFLLLRRNTYYGKSKNMVIAGDYQGKGVMGGAKPGIVVKIFRPLYLDSTTVESYEVITDEHRKSAASGVARGLVGGALLGPVGMLAGGLSAKDKGIYQIAIQIYKAIVAMCF